MREIVDLRDTSTDDLVVQEKELKESIFRLSFRCRLGDGESAKKIAKTKKRLARVKTLLRGRELGIAK